MPEREGYAPVRLEETCVLADAGTLGYRVACPPAAGAFPEGRVQETGVRNGAHGADKFGLRDLKAVHWNLTEAPLYEHAIRNGEATIVAGGALCAETGHHTGRSPAGRAAGSPSIAWGRGVRTRPRATTRRTPTWTPAPANAEPRP